MQEGGEKRRRSKNYFWLSLLFSKYYLLLLGLILLLQIIPRTNSLTTQRTAFITTTSATNININININTFLTSSSTTHRTMSTVSSSTSMASGFRHAKFAPSSLSSSNNNNNNNNESTNPSSRGPDKKLMTDSSHRPKTRGSFGILVVGLGGANGTTMLAGILANRLSLQWFGPKGESLSPNYNGCITQLTTKGVHGGVGYRNRSPALDKRLGDASMAAVGGWDIRSTPPGDALLEAQILDYDLVRQVRPEMNKIKIFRGLFDPRFIGTSQHETATYVLTEQDAQSDSEALKCLRADIRYFKWRNGVVGHTTVIWSASVEPNSDLVSKLKTANDLMCSIDLSEEERGGPLPPSLLYATAALLEGCSFVNGGSQNTLDCPALWELAKQQLGVYCLGTDFKAGQVRKKKKNRIIMPCC
jgi:myo-inositol-1-phosphate synthase